MNQTKLFLDLHLAKILDTSTKSFFPCKCNFQWLRICLFRSNL